MLKNVERIKFQISLVNILVYDMVVVYIYGRENRMFYEYGIVFLVHPRPRRDLFPSMYKI